MFAYIAESVVAHAESNEGGIVLNAANQDVKEWLAYQSLLRGTACTLAQFIIMRDEWEKEQAENPCEVWSYEESCCTCGDRGVCPTCDPAEWDVSKW